MTIFTKIIHTRETFFGKEPTLIGIVGGYKFYENPDLGDKAPLVAIKDGILGHTDFWELPNLMEIEQMERRRTIPTAD